MDDKELLDIVDENDVVIGKDSKENKFTNELISRNVAIFIIDETGKLIIAKRAAHKKSFPGRFDLAACGNVKSGESYQEAAVRELMEELKISCEVKMIEKIYNEFPENGKSLKYFTGIFLGKYSQDIKLNNELESFKKLSVNEVQNLIDKNPNLFTPGFVNDFLLVKDKLNNRFSG